MKVVIFGSRTFTDYEALCNVIKTTVFYQTGLITTIISGTARGADVLGERFAREHNIDLIRMPAEWNRYGKAAGLIRNKAMAEIADLGIGFWDGNTSHSGTYNMIKQCEKMNIPLIIYRTDTKIIGAGRPVK